MLSCMKSSSLGLVFILGCATGGVASQLVVPPARAETPPTRWEYLCGKGDVTTSKFNEAGAQGWELVAVARIPGDSTFCFKRRTDS